MVAIRVLPVWALGASASAREETRSYYFIIGSMHLLVVSIKSTTSITEIKCFFC
jgi:hypothetical protein